MFIIMNDSVRFKGNYYFLALKMISVQAHINTTLANWSQQQFSHVYHWSNHSTQNISQGWPLFCWVLHTHRFNAVLLTCGVITHIAWLGKFNIKQNKATQTHHNVNKRKNTNTHHFWINCGNKGATSWGQTNPRRPIVIAKNTLIDRKRNKVMQSEQQLHARHTDMAHSHCINTNNTTVAVKSYLTLSTCSYTMIS